MNAPPRLYPRRIAARVVKALSDTPVVLIAGPRPAGKTTKARQIAAQHPELRYFTLDDELTLPAAREKPVGMIRRLDRAILDEIQRAPSLLLAIKKAVARVGGPGVFC